MGVSQPSTSQKGSLHGPGGGGHRLSIGWESSRAKKCLTWFLTMGNRTSNQESVISLCSYKIKMPALVYKEPGNWIRGLRRHWHTPRGNTASTVMWTWGQRLFSLDKYTVKLPSPHIVCGPVCPGWDNWGKQIQCANTGKNDAIWQHLVNTY